MKFLYALLFRVEVFCITFADNFRSFQNGKLFSFGGKKSSPKSLTARDASHRIIIKLI